MAATADVTLADVASHEADALVKASRQNAAFIRRKIEMEEERLDRIELFIFRRVSFLHQSVSSPQ